MLQTPQLHTIPHDVESHHRQLLRRIEHGIETLSHANVSRENEIRGLLRLRRLYAIEHVLCVLRKVIYLAFIDAEFLMEVFRKHAARYEYAVHMLIYVARNQMEHAINR